MEFTGSRKVRKPLPVRVVLVRPEYSMNVGMVARACKNFSVTDLAIVAPKCKLGFEATKYAKHSQEVLNNAKMCNSLEEAVAGFDLVVGTTGVVRRFTGSLKNCVSLPALNVIVSNRNIAIVFGPEGNGLTQGELDKCDVVATIPAERAHPVLNLSHAVAVVLYSLFFSQKTRPLFKPAAGKELRALNYLVSSIVDELRETHPPLRDAEKAKIAFKRVFGRTNMSQTEAQTLMAVFSRAAKKLKSLEHVEK